MQGLSEHVPSIVFLFQNRTCIYAGGATVLNIHFESSFTIKMRGKLDGTSQLFLFEKNINDFQRFGNKAFAPLAGKDF